MTPRDVRSVQLAWAPAAGGGAYPSGDPPLHVARDGHRRDELEQAFETYHAGLDGGVEVFPITVSTGGAL
jgi:hypothetical protein